MLTLFWGEPNCPCLFLAANSTRQVLRQAEPVISSSHKAELRKAVKTRLVALSAQTFTAAGFAAALHLPLIPHWAAFSSVLVFCSMKDEIDTRPIMETALKAGKQLFAPRIEGEALAFYRIDQNCLSEARSYWEPEADPALALKPADFPALVITPGLAFDRSLNRLGRGGGYYDRFFSSLILADRQYSALGLCLDCQLVDELPVDPWDKKVDLLITERGTPP